MSNQQLWQAILGHLEITLSKGHFNTWFKNTGIVERAEDALTIGVPSTYHRDWISGKYQAEMLRALKTIAPEIRVIKYHVGGTSKQATQAVTANPAAPHIPENGNLRNGLNPKYVFESFIIGKHNELANAAAMAVSKSPGGQYNPLFIYGGVGLGKTHLMQAVGNSALAQNQKANILYVTSEKFTNDYIGAIQSKRMEDFKQRYRTVDMLLIDDIQFIAGKEGTQEEFFHTFNELRDRGRQIIITSDRLPKEIPAIEQRLVSRFEWGMIADIQAPDLETRLAILSTKLQKKGLTLDRDVLYYIAENVQNNVRELEGALNRLIISQQMGNRQMTLEYAKQILASMVGAKKKITSVRKIATLVAEFYNISMEDLVKQSRRKEFVKPRQIAMFLARRELESSFPSIGEFFGNRDHTTVMHAVEKIGKEILDKDQFKQELDLILDKLYIT